MVKWALAVLVWGLYLPLQAQARDITVGFPENQEPYVIFEEGQGRGIAFETMDRAFKKCQWNAKYRAMPSARTIERLKSGAIDAGGLIPAAALPGFFESERFFQPENCLVTLAENNIHIGKLEHLKGRRVVSFKNAQYILDKPQLDEIKRLSDYQEMQGVEKRLKLLVNKRVDVMLTERQILLYHSLRLGFGDAKKYTFSCILNSTKMGIVFAKKEDRDEFNQCLK
ncbi:hypothetical protein AZI87_12765 [Bdellovibrio bacteriovorus]|uniref:Uncharacterized protein n=1 Tax=Bdellovibrio bacteriovorus TaxID=959 RepID=A0A161PSC3_BDEBC|nr:transporter substrate-binding domain-containing protein [Bdellovibrio bacteriovorus]KYG65408.1 hypothetical protein AZI87_12765 [Bdellovibrio bacteriovorus]